MPYRILVAEDSRTQAEELQSLLEDEGFEVEVAPNGRLALEKSESFAPDLVLSDLFMPEMDGFALCQAIKSREETRRAPVILLTQLNTPSGIEIALQHGADDFIAKPYDEDLLLERIRTHLAASGGSATRPAPGLEKLPLERASLLLDQREQALRASHDYLEQLIGASPGVVVRGDATAGTLSFASANLEELLGFPAEKAVKSEGFLWSRIHPNEKERTLASLREAHAEGRDRWHTECRFQREDGAYCWCYFTVRFEHRSGNGAAPLVAHLLDITARKEAEARLQVLNETLERRVVERTAALRASEERYRRIIETTPDGIWVTDADDVTTFVNARMAEILGYTVDEMLGQPVSALIHEEDEASTRESLERRRQGEPQKQDFRFRRRDGEPLWAMISATPVLQGGAYAGAVAVVTDISERRKIEEQLRQALKMEAIGQLAGGVAHDFNNMLAVINGYSEMLLMDADLPPRARGFLSEINRAGERAGGLTRQLLAFSRRQVLEPKVLDLSDVVEDMAAMLQRMIGEDVTLVTHSDPELGLVRADRGQMEQVLMNLAVNARDAMPRGGRLEIETRNANRHAAVESSPTGEQTGASVMLVVRDHGCGMAAEVRSHLFEPFFTTKGEGKGTGLGLATVYGIVTQSGGEIKVESEPGLGATFRIYLPCVAEDAHQASEPPAATAPRGTATILLVEDEPMVRQLVGSILQSHGYTVMDASNPGEALHLGQRYKGELSLLLTDVVMPDMGGRELYERLHLARPQIKVLYMSGHTDDAVLRRGVLIEQQAFIQKPFTPSGLLEKVREVLDKG